MSGDLGVGAIGFHLTAGSVAALFAALLRLAFGIAALFMLARIAWSYFLFKTHGGNHDKEENAKATLKEGLVGMVVVCVGASVARGAVALATTVAARYLS